MRAFFLTLSLVLSLAAFADHGLIPAITNATVGAQSGRYQTSGKEDTKKGPTIAAVAITGKYKGSGATFLEKFNVFQAQMTDSTVTPKLTDNLDLTKAKSIDFTRPKLARDTLTNKDFLSSGNGRNLIIQLGGEADDEPVRAFLRGAVEELEVTFTDVPLLNGGRVSRVTLRIRR